MIRGISMRIWPLFCFRDAVLKIGLSQKTFGTVAGGSKELRLGSFTGWSLSSHSPSLSQRSHRQSMAANLLPLDTNTINERKLGSMGPGYHEWVLNRMGANSPHVSPERYASAASTYNKSMSKSSSSDRNTGNSSPSMCVGPGM